MVTDVKTDHKIIYGFGGDRNRRGSERSGRTQSSAVVDGWFDAQLSELYGEVAEEPIPQDLLELVDRLNRPK